MLSRNVPRYIINSYYFDYGVGYSVCRQLCDFMCIFEIEIVFRRVWKDVTMCGKMTQYALSFRPA